MIQELIKERKLPELMKMKDGSPVTEANWDSRRKELVRILGENVYGIMPEYSGGTFWHETETYENAAGNAVTRKVEITFPTPDKASFTFPVTVTTPCTAAAAAPKAAFVFISFGYPKYYPMEELADHDVIVAEMVMNDVALDQEDHYANQMASHYWKDGKRPGSGFGKIGMWAFAASRVLDYLLSLDYVDPAHVGVIGHSRLGKTALWAGANDTRFTHVFSNDSGCCGAALTRGKTGETFPDIYRNFPYWFCENFKTYAQSTESSASTAFDQHFLLAAAAPRKVYAASAQKDDWADPVSEYLCCAAASAAWELQGLPGFLHPDRLPESHDCFADGNIGYHCRPGIHFLSRHDWIRYCEFLKK